MVLKIKNKSSKKGWRKVIKWLLIILVLIFASISGIFLREIKKTTEDITSDITVTSLREREVNIEASEPINVLLVGTDGNQLDRSEEEGYISRSDTLMLVNLDPVNRQTNILSIPRDTLTIVDGEADKINHAFAYGGINLTIETVQDFLKVPIDYYAVINMSGLEELIDAIGGVEVTSPLTFSYRGTNFKKGETREVNGVKAMNFARMRYDDPKGEIGRQDRQKILIKAIVDKMLSLNIIANFTDILDIVNEYVLTNLDPSLVIKLYEAYLPALDEINIIRFQDIEEVYHDNVFYFYIPTEERLRVSNLLRRYSGMSSINRAQLTDPLEGRKPNMRRDNIDEDQEESIIRNRLLRESVVEFGTDTNFQEEFAEEEPYGNTNTDSTNYMNETEPVQRPSSTYNETFMEETPQNTSSMIEPTNEEDDNYILEPVNDVPEVDSPSVTPEPSLNTNTDDNQE